MFEQLTFKRYFFMNFLLLHAGILFPMTFQKTSQGTYDKGTEITVLNNNGERIGDISYNVFGCRADIVSMTIAKEYRRKGIGTRLMQEALNDMKNRKCTVVTVEAADEGSQAFYKQSGFIIESREIPWCLQWMCRIMALVPMKYRLDEAKIKEKEQKRENRRIEQFKKFRETLS